MEIEPFKYNIAVYNIYGVTEVSSWSAMEKITEDDIPSIHGSPSDLEPSSDCYVRDWVPIGKPMLNTDIVLKRSEEDERFLFIWTGTKDFSLN